MIYSQEIRNGSAGCGAVFRCTDKEVYAMNDPPVLQGLRRAMTRDDFEELAALQCEEAEILGYVGTTRDRLEKWCRRTYRRRSLDHYGCRG